MERCGARSWGIWGKVEYLRKVNGGIGEGHGTGKGEWLLNTNFVLPLGKMGNFDVDTKLREKRGGRYTSGKKKRTGSS